MKLSLNVRIKTVFPQQPGYWLSLVLRLMLSVGLQLVFPLVLSLCFIPYSTQAQEFPSTKFSAIREIDPQQFIEQLFPVQDDELPYEELYEALFLYFTQPLDLNKATAEEMKSLFILSDVQIQHFFRHIARHGKLLSIFELQSIPGWDLPTIYRLLPFVDVPTGAGAFSGPLGTEQRRLLQRIRESGKGMFLQRYERVLETRAGYLPRADSLPPAYLGSADKLYTRFRFNRPHDFSFGLTLEKDAGERIAWRPAHKQYGADFISYHAMLYNQGRFSKIVLGDFQLQFGQSLVFGAGFSLGKGAETITTIRRSSTGLRPYTAVQESGFFRGAGLSFKLSPSLEITTFYSNAPRDALLQEATNEGAAGLADGHVDEAADDHVDGDSSDSFPDTGAGGTNHQPYTDPHNSHYTFSSLQQSGMHRTARELSARHSLREQSTGAVVHYHSKNRRLQLGATSLFTQFSHPWQRRPQLYNLFEFNGKQNFTGSFFGEYSWQNINLFTEIARSLSGGNALVAGCLLALSSELDLSFLARRYERNFHSFYGTAFAESSRPINEQGLYWGLKYKPLPELMFTAYYDRFFFPWLRYRVDAPSDGHEYLLRANFQPSRKILLFGQLRQEVKALNNLQLNNMRIPMEGNKRNYLIQLDFAPSAALSLKSRVQWSSYTYAEIQTTGYALAQDLNWAWKSFKFSGRMALFDTQDFNNRQYVYEKDVLWAFSIPAYYGKGIRNYLLVQYKLNQQFSLWFRWGRTVYVDREQISSGHERIEGSKINQVKAQIRWTF